MLGKLRITDWTSAYENGAHIEGAGDFPPRWMKESTELRQSLGDRAVLDIPYGAGERQKFDLFLPEGEPKGLSVFVHGGYWKAFDKSAWSWLAAGPLAKGWAVAMPSYTLAPEARIADISAEIAMAIAAAAERVSGPIRLTGHSAGGHLVARMITTCSPLVDGVLNRVERVVPISGLHDLRPLILTEMNDTLKIDLDEAMAESPALLAPVTDSRVLCWVGANERPEFLRQNALLANIWAGLGAEMALHEEPGKHHFDVIECLANPSSAFIAEFLEG